MNIISHTEETAKTNKINPDFFTYIIISFHRDGWVALDKNLLVTFVENFSELINKNMKHIDDIKIPGSNTKI